MSTTVTVAACHLCHGIGTHMGSFCVCGVGRRLAAWHDYKNTPPNLRLIAVWEGGTVTDRDPGDEA